MEAIGVIIDQNFLVIAAAAGEVLRFDLDAQDKKSAEIAREILQSERIKVFDDAKPILKLLKEKGFDVSKPIFDVYLAEKIVESGIPGERRNPSSASELISLREKLIKEIAKNNLIDVCKLEFDCVFAVVEMEFAGIKLDVDKWRALSDRYTEEQKRLRDELLRGFGEGFGELNLNSPQQMLAAFESKGIVLKSTSHQALMERKEGSELIAKFLEYRRVAKALQSFLLPIPRYIDEKTGRLHPSYNQLGAVSGRFSSEEPNIQQIPRDKEFRECFIPEVGNKLIIADYSQIELRVAAEIADDAVMREAYIKGIDLHLLTASIVTGKPIEEITKQERQAAKAMNFGLIYGMGAKGFQIYAKSTYGVPMTIKEAVAFRNKFFDAYKGIAAWHKRTGEMPDVKELRTLSGRRVLLRERPGISALLNIPIQGTAADIVKKALSDLVPTVKELGWHIVAVVHDEILLEVPEKAAKGAAVTLKNVMEAAGAYYLKNVPVVAEAVIADSWAEK